MKWINHKLLTGATIYAVTGNPIATIFATAGSIIPDAIEGFPNENNITYWQQNHRQFSHWFPPYLIAFFIFFALSLYLGIANILPQQYTLRTVLYTLFTLPENTHYAIGSYGLAYISLGACFHIAQDAICGKVPSLNPNQRIGTKLFYVGSFKEYLYVFPISAALLLLRHHLAS